MSSDRPRSLPEMQADLAVLWRQARRYIVAQDVLCAEQVLADARGVLGEIRAYHAARCAEMARINPWFYAGVV